MGGGGGENRADHDDDWELAAGDGLADVTLVLVGKVGSGKSATANSILGSEAFASEWSYGSVTKTCQMRSTEFHDGQAVRTINVIDTPGLFDMDITTEDVRKEIVKCMEMAKDGIHAMLMVFSAKSRFSCEDEKTIESIKLFFGDKILDHMILVFTHGDEVGGETSWKNMLSATAPPYLQNFLKLCTNRVVLVDNKTSNAQNCQAQLKKLLDAVDFVISGNHGVPFLNQLFNQIQVEEKLNSTILRLEQQLLKEQKARLNIQDKMTEAILRSEEDIHRLRESLEKAQQESNNAREENRKFRESEKARQEKEKQTEGEFQKLKEKLEKARQEQEKQTEREFDKLKEELEKARQEREKQREEEKAKARQEKECIIL